MKRISRIPDDLVGFSEHVSISCSEVFIFGADIAGKVIKQIIEHEKINVSGFIDNNKNKTDVDLDGVFVYHALEFFEKKSKSAVIVIASTYISDIIRQLEDHGFYNWIPIVKFIEPNNGIKYRNMLRGELRKNHAGGEFSSDFDIFVLENMRNSQTKYLDEGLLFIRSIDIVITERCSLKCKDCSNLMHYYENPVNIEYGQVLREIDAVCELADEINELRIIGGDALMNKNFPQIVNHAASKVNVKKVVVYTNGTISPKAEKIAEIGNNDKVFVFITTYGSLSKNAEVLEGHLKAYGIQYNKQPAYGWTDCGRIVKHNRDEEQKSQIFQNCCAKHFTTLTDDKLFRCPFAANLFRLNAAELPSSDFIDVSDLGGLSSPQLTERRSEVRAYLRELPYMEACNYCNGRTYGDPEIVPGVQIKAPLSYDKAK